jgi:hypothetical protein
MSAFRTLFEWSPAFCLTIFLPEAFAEFQSIIENSYKEALSNQRADLAALRDTVSLRSDCALN